MRELCPAEQITGRNFSGLLLINGNLQENCIFFRFLFDKPEMVQPLILKIKVSPVSSLKKHGKHGKKNHVFECNIRDLNNPVMHTGILYPEFSLKKSEIRVKKIKSQIGIK